MDNCNLNHNHETKQIQQFVFVNENDAGASKNQLIITKEAPASPCLPRPATPVEKTGMNIMMNNLLPPTNARAQDTNYTKQETALLQVTPPENITIQPSSQRATDTYTNS